MPPEQCPECGRFLTNALVASLAGSPAACPGCGSVLEARMFASEDAGGPGRPAPGRATERAGPVPGPGPAADVLAGWDVDGDSDSWRDDQPPLPTDALWVASSAAAGGLVGALVAVRRSRGVLVGGVLGALAAGIARRMWRLDQ